MDYINYEDFEKLNIRVGKIKAVEPHPKLQDYILLIDLGPVERDMQIVTDLKESYRMDELIGRQIVFIENFEPQTIGEVESQGLLLITHKEGKPVLLQPDKEVLTGVKIYGIKDTELSHHIKKDLE
jgi:methionyl-tRNA synthetase